MGVARKWHFSKSGGTENLGGVFGDQSEHRGSGITLLGITSLFMHKLTGLQAELFNKYFCNQFSENSLYNIGIDFLPNGRFHDLRFHEFDVYLMVSLQLTPFNQLVYLLGSNVLFIFFLLQLTP